MTARRHQPLEGKRSDVFLLDPDDVFVPDLASHPLYDARVQEKITEEFVRNVDAEGVHQPIFVTKERWAQPHGRTDAVVLVAGRKRILAARAVNRLRAQSAAGCVWARLTVPAILKKGDERSLVALMILENEGRHADTPLNVARKTARYLELVGGDKRKAAEVFTVTVKTVEARLKLIDLSPAVQAAVEEGKVGLWAATELATVAPAKQPAALERLLETSAAEGLKPSVEAAKKAAGKKGAVKRSEVAGLREALLNAADGYGASREAEHAIKPATKSLLEAAHAFYLATRREEGCRGA